MTLLSDLRLAVQGLATEGLSSVSVVRQAFVDGVAPAQTVSSGSAASFISQFGATLAPELIRSTSRFGLSTSPVGTVVRPVRPNLDFIEVATDQTYGMLDSFYVRAVISFKMSDVTSIAGIRLLRSFNGKLKIPSPAFSALIDGQPTGHSRNGNDPIGIPAMRAAEIGVGNKLTEFVSIDGFSGERVVISSGSLRSLPVVPNTNRTSVGTAGLLSLDNADRSVLENVTFYINRRSVDPMVPIELPTIVGARQGINVLQGTSISSSRTLVQRDNSGQFREILRIPISSANWRQVGDHIEVEVFDPSVVFGNSYTYYVVANDKAGAESPRSRMVTVQVRLRKPPASPDVMYSVIGGRPRFSIKATGKFIDHIEVFRKGGVAHDNVRLLGSDRGMIVDSASQAVGQFYHIGDLGVSADRSTSFTDLNVLPGQKVEYRFYTVDSFGNKSQNGFECEIRLPARGLKTPLDVPSITAEQGPGERHVRISVACDDPRIVAFTVSRREIGNSEYKFHQPSSPAYVALGNSSAKRARSRVGPILNDSEKAWNGILRVTSGSAVMSDTAVGYDRTYQYLVQAIDVRGNLSSAVPSNMVRVSVKPISDKPVSVKGRIVEGEDGPLGVEISWEPGTLDFSPNELIDDQDVLSATSIRTVFQVERRIVGGAVWEALPATTGTTFIDPVSVLPSPNFRTAYVDPMQQYDYRVIAMQSGGFLSNYTDSVRMAAIPSLVAPAVLWVRSTDTAINPINNVISWDYSGDYVEGWEVERAAVNKIYGAQLISLDSPDVKNLSYVHVSTIRRESSRGTGLATTTVDDPQVYVGNRYYIDQDVSLVNSYFYRVRAIDSNGKSTWTYGGISLREPIFDLKLASVLSDDDRMTLALDPQPLTLTTQTPVTTTTVARISTTTLIKR